VTSALLFDFDGVIVDTEVATFEAWRGTYAEFGVELTLEDWLPAVGTGSSTSGVFDAIAHLETLIGARVDREHVIARTSQRKAKLYVTALLLPGVRERLAEARERGLRTAIVTRNRDDRVEATCARVHLDHPWDARICADHEPTRDKSELYRIALRRLRVGAEAALAFEDSPAGVDAARRADVRCVAVPNDITRTAPFGGATVLIPSLARYSLGEILAMAGD
jgi:HAD superfamily hydrolase (TIGR01509 family)